MADLYTWLTNPEDEKKSITAIHRVFTAFFFSCHEDIDTYADQDPIILFLISYNMATDDGNFKSPALMATSCTMLFYNLRTIALKEVNDQYRVKRASGNKDGNLMVQ